MIAATVTAGPCPSADAIARLLEGRARPGEAEAIDSHVDRCAGCFELLARLARHRAADTEDSHGVQHAEEMPLRAGDRIGRHVVDELIGRGGMGLVYAAYDPVLRRSIAIKLVRPTAGRDRAAADRAHLRREAQALARLSHPNVVPIHDLGQLGTQLWVAMERVDGVTLRGWLLAHPHAGWRERLAILRDAGEALAAAHHAGIVHRDFKPDNVMVGRDGRVRVLDFGLARLHAVPASVMPTLVSGRDDDETPTRGAVGTPAYMAPEQHLGLEIDARADQFAFAVTAWEVLFGERPFAGTSATAIPTAIAVGDIRPPRTRGLEAFASVLRRALAAAPDDRWPDIMTLLRRLRIDPRQRSRRRRLAAIAVLAVSGVGLLAQWTDRESREACASAADLQLPRTATMDARVVERLDAFTTAWNEAEHAACLAELDEHATGATRACHREIAAAWTTASVVIGDGDATLRARAMELIDDLPALEKCSAPEPARVSANSAAAIAASALLRERLSRAVVLYMAGQDADARDEVRAIVDAAREAGDEAILADALVRAGEIEESAGDFVRAEDAYVEGYWLAVRQDRDPTAVAAAAAVAQLLGNRLGRMDEARDWIRHGEAILARTRDTTPARLGSLAQAIAAIDHTDGRVDEAVAGFRRVAELYTLAHGAESGNVATARANLAAALLDAGRYDDALVEVDLALDLHARTWGADHPALARDRLIRGNTLYFLGRLDEAEEEFRRAGAVAERSLEPDHPDFVAYYTGLGIVANAQGRTDDAIAWHTRALEIQERTVGPDHADVGIMVNNIGSALSAAGRDAEAIPWFERSLAIFRHAYGDEHAAVGSAQHDLALAHHGLDHEPEAIAGYRAAIATWSRALGERHAMIGRARTNLGNALLDDGQLDAAFAEYRLSIEINSEAVGEDDPTTAKAWSRLGLALAKHGRPKEAIAPLRRAIELREGGPDPERVAELREALAAARSQ